MTAWDIYTLLQPYDWETFVSQYWQRQPLYIGREDPDFFRELVTLDDVDFLIATRAGKRDFPLSVIGSYRNMSTAYEARPTSRTYWTPDRVYDRFAHGATIRIGNMSHYLDPIRRLVASFEAALNTDIGINLYLTPRQARAFEAHFDNHDVFIIQIEGEKVWKLFEPPEDLPIEVVYRGRTNWLLQKLPFDAQFVTRPPVKTEQEIHLHAGDLLYVPRGHVHQVFTSDTHSLHLTIAAPVVTWYEVIVHALMAVFTESRELREALPPGFAVDKTKWAEACARTPEIVEALCHSMDANKLTDSLEEMALRFINSRTVDWHGQATNIERLAEISIDTILRIRPSLAYTTRTFQTSIYLLFSGRSVRLPIRTDSMLKYILEHKQFRIGDLPTPLSDNSRLIFTTTLVQRGFLEILEEGA